MIKYLVIYLVLINIITFVMYALDKVKAKANIYRIPEKLLIVICFLGGGIGGLTGMLVCRHKTKKARFIILVPISILFNIILTVLILERIA